MNTVPVFMVEKFFPPRCPKCEQSFASTADFAEYAGGPAGSFVEAKIRQAQVFPELFGSTSSDLPGVFRFSNKFDTDFIICKHCNNVTLRISYASRRVTSRDEAERLVTSGGFTFWREGEAIGNMAQPGSRLSLLGAADLAKLSSVVLQAKQRVTQSGQPQANADVFASEVDPVLVELMNKIRETQVTTAAGERLRAIFGSLWQRLVADCRDFLVTAEVLKDNLVSLTETDPSIDFSPAVAAYSKALEKAVLERLFRPFLSFDAAAIIPEQTGRSDQDRSLASLRKFVTTRRDLTLGDMAFCLLNVGCKLRSHTQNGFARFLSTKISNLDAFCGEFKFPGRLIEYVEEFRNKSAHVAKLSKDSCMGARAFILEEPVRLLLVLEEALMQPE